MADPALKALRDAVVARLDGLAGLRSRGMFGGYGLWAEEGLFFGIVDDGRVYFRTDASTRPGYAGSTGFRYAADEPESETYRSVPEEVLADPAALLGYAEYAVDATRRAKAAKRRPRGGA
jgi:TfoX/Sxy family transcriptional regulator of competence genes